MSNKGQKGAVFTEMPDPVRISITDSDDGFSQMHETMKEMLVQLEGIKKTLERAFVDRVGMGHISKDKGH